MVFGSLLDDAQGILHHIGVFPSGGKTMNREMAWAPIVKAQLKQEIVRVTKALRV